MLEPSMEKTRRKCRTMFDKLNPGFRSKLGKAAIAVFSLAALSVLPASAADEFHLKLNQDEVENTLTQQSFDIAQPITVFESVLRALPKKVTVYPTESYYYFSFFHKGVNYNGNIRFDAFDQFDGKVHFAYTQEYVLWRKPEEPAYQKLGPEQGVKVEKIDKLNYKLTYKDVSVDFVLVDLSDVKPPETMVRPDETYIGPVWDESGIQFYLFFNKTAKVFLYVLNEQGAKTDVFEPTEFSPEITVGARTSFAFYKDKLMDRKILIGVFAGNSQVNNYFDGPFDQLPDNFIEGNTLHDALLQIGPWMEGKIDRYGSVPDGSERYAVTPYMYYDRLEDMKSIEECAKGNDDPEKYFGCFNIVMPDDGPPGEEPKNGEDPENKEPAEPQAPKRD